MYLSTTDYVQHKHAPGTPAANAFYEMMDGYLAQLDALGATIALTADHGMNAKTDAGRRAADHLPAGLARRAGSAPARRASSCRSPIPTSCTTARSARSPPSTCRPARDAAELGERLARAPGIEVGALARPRPRARFELPPDRMGDLVVISERLHVLGTSAGAPRSLGPRRAAALARRPHRAARAAAVQPAAARRRLRGGGCAISTSSTSP